MGSNIPTYNEEQVNFLREMQKGITRRELTKLFNERFNTNVPYNTIRSWCVKFKLYSDNDGKFKVGHNRLWQKGLSKEEFRSHYSAKSFNTMIKPMNDASWKYKVGDTVIRHGTAYIYIDDSKNLAIDKRIKLKSHVVYEKANGQIPKNHKIIYLDGDKANCDLDNLYLVPNKFIGVMNKNKWITGNKQATLTAIKWCELFYTLRS